MGCIANRGGSGHRTCRADAVRESGRRGLFESAFAANAGRSEFRSRADERLSAVEPERLSRADRAVPSRAHFPRGEVLFLLLREAVDVHAHAGELEAGDYADEKW